MSWLPYKADWFACSQDSLRRLRWCMSCHGKQQHEPAIGYLPFASAQDRPRQDCSCRGLRMLIRLPDLTRLPICSLFCKKATAQSTQIGHPTRFLALCYLLPLLPRPLLLTRWSVPFDTAKGMSESSELATGDGTFADASLWQYWSTCNTRDIV